MFQNKAVRGSRELNIKGIPFYVIKDVLERPSLLEFTSLQQLRKITDALKYIESVFKSLKPSDDQNAEFVIPLEKTFESVKDAADFLKESVPKMNSNYYQVLQGYIRLGEHQFRKFIQERFRRNH